MALVTMRRSLTIVLLALTSALSACSNAPIKAKQSSFVHAIGRFSVEMPAKDDLFALGEVVAYDLYHHERSYFFAVVELSPEEAAAGKEQPLLEHYQDHMLRLDRTKSTVRESAFSQVLGYSAIECTADEVFTKYDNSGTIARFRHMRMIAVGNQLIVLSLTGRDVTRADADAYFTSLKIADK